MRLSESAMTRLSASPVTRFSASPLTRSSAPPVFKLYKTNINNKEYLKKHFKKDFIFGKTADFEGKTSKHVAAKQNGCSPNKKKERKINERQLYIQYIFIRNIDKSIVLLLL